MRIGVHCHQCVIDGRPGRVAAIVDLRDDIKHEVTCDGGHRFFMVLQNPRYEVLGDSAALALVDGYYREAVASFAAALEAFWGHYVRVAARKLGAPPETIERLRKVLKLSERRIGAMHLAHLLLVRAPYAGDGEKIRTFRNDVVHDGKFPTREEAFRYAEHVYTTVLDGVAELLAHARAEMSAETGAFISEPHAQAWKADPTARRTTMHVSTLLSGVIRESGRLPFDDALRAWKSANVWALARDFEAVGAVPGAQTTPSRDELGEAGPDADLEAPGHSSPRE